MPNMTGIEFVRKIREDSGNDGVKLVMVTSNKTMEFVTEALDEAGANGFISKPFTPQDMRKKLGPLVEDIIALKKKKQGLMKKIFGS